MTWVESVIMGYSGDERQSAVMSAALVPWVHHVKKGYSKGGYESLNTKLVIIGRMRWCFKLSNAKAITGSYICILQEFPFSEHSVITVCVIATCIFTHVLIMENVFI